ncbi:MAG: hypothetical protein O2971_00005 [Proteobacteria bacterium]|nr:hypothetical protein [Pseudomonadota bacterium]
MNEAEAISALTGFISEINSTYIDYISVISAFLIMSYFAAHKLNAKLMYVVVVLFTIVAGNIIFSLFLLNNDLDHLYAYIIEQKLAGTYDLPWFGMNPEWASPTLTALQVFSTIGGYLGCIFFFFYQRTHGQDENGT